MAGSWEIKASNQVLVGILHTDVTSIAWSFGLRNLKIPGDPALRTFDPFCPVAGMPFDHARNTICYKALEVGARYVFMYDSDVVPPSNTIERLIAHNKPFISGMYCRRSPPHAVPVMIKNGGWYLPPVLGKVESVDLVGSGCLLIDTELFKKIPPVRPGKLAFDWTVDMKGIVPEGLALSEDFRYCKHLKDHGIEILVDTSIMCLHVGNAESNYQSYLPSQVRTMT